MKKILSLVCALVLLLTCIGPVPAKAAAADTMTLSSVFLRSAEGKEGIFFGAYFNLSQDTLNNMARYGLALTPKTLADDDAWTAAMDGSVQRSWYETGLTAGVRKEVQSTSLVNIINISNDSMTNNRNANTVIYVRPYVEMKDGSFVYGDVGSITMKEVAQMVDAIYSTLTDAQKRGLLGMYERFTSCMKGWGLSNIKADYPYGTDVNGESLILQYRRNKAVANMTDQNNVLWSIETADGESVKYSRAPTSSGVDNTEEQDEVYTLYPGRVYRGIPYTHGSAGLDAFKLLAGSPDANGVYTFQNFNSSYFNGGSSTNTYNSSRLGNDCWDAVYWAWAGLGNSVTAGQTQQMTESYGLKLLGEDILAEAMKGFVAPDGRVMGEGEDAVWEFICNQSSAGLYGYRSIKEGEDTAAKELSYTGTFEGSFLQGGTHTFTYTKDFNHAVDGTMLVSYAIRTFTGEIVPKEGTLNYYKQENYNLVFDYQALYQTYALAQPGDAMVHFENTQGHAIMVVDMNVVYNQDGTINGDESTITLLEQGSGHESRQSRDTWGSYTQSAHSDHSDFLDDCKYCAGYIEDENIWALDYGRQVRSFHTLAEANYLAVTCEELVNPAAKIAASRITDSKSSATVTGVYSGTLASTYRVSHITLDVFDESGAKINSSTCFGIQSGNTTAFSLSRFVSDQNAFYGSVLKGTPALEYHTYKYVVTDSEGNTVYNYKASDTGNYYLDTETNTYIEITGDVVAPEGATLYTRTEKTSTATWLEAPDLPVGAYSYTLTCVLANGYTKTFRSGFFTVGAGTTPVEGNSVTNMVFAD